MISDNLVDSPSGITRVQINYSNAQRPISVDERQQQQLQQQLHRKQSLSVETPISTSFNKSRTIMEQQINTNTANNSNYQQNQSNGELMRIENENKRNQTATMTKVLNQEAGNINKIDVKIENNSDSATVSLKACKFLETFYDGRKVWSIIRDEKDIEEDMFMVNDEENLIKIDVKAATAGDNEIKANPSRKSKNLRVRINDTNENNPSKSVRKLRKKYLKPRNCQKIVFIFVLIILLFLFIGILLYFFGWNIVSEKK